MRKSPKKKYFNTHSDFINEDAIMNNYNVLTLYDNPTFGKLDCEQLKSWRDGQPCDSKAWILVYFLVTKLE